MYDISALAGKLAEIEQGKSNCTSVSSIICLFSHSITFCEVGAGLVFLSRGQRYCTAPKGHLQRRTSVGRFLVEVCLTAPLSGSYALRFLGESRIILSMTSLIEVLFPCCSQLFDRILANRGEHTVAR